MEHPIVATYFSDPEFRFLAVEKVGKGKYLTIRQRGRRYTLNCILFCCLSNCLIAFFRGFLLGIPPMMLCVEICTIHNKIVK